MIRDLLGNRIRKPISSELQEYMEKYYLYKGKVFQIVRISKIYKLDGGPWIEMQVINDKTKKIQRVSLSFSSFKEKKIKSIKSRLFK